MKKTKLTIVFAAIALALSGCNVINTKSHEHHFNSQWSYNDNFHWHACDSCDEVKDKAEHSFGEWHIEKEATEYELGSKYRLCIDCEYKQVAEIEKLPHTHKFSSTWESDDNYHWHVCTECHEEDEKIAHTYDDGVIVAPTFEEQGYTKYTCSICEHIKKADFTETLPHSFSDEWKYDSTGHWHPCLDEGYEDAILNKEPHSYSETIVPATSEEQGYTIYTCECGYTYNDNFVNLFEFDTLSDETISLKAGEGARLVEELIIPTSTDRGNGFSFITCGDNQFFY